MNQMIETPRLVLRPLRMDDVLRLIALADDPRIARMLTRMPHPYREADAIDYIAGAMHADWEFAIELDGELAGCCGLTDHLGYWLGCAYWGHGYATEAAAALVSAYFARTNEKHIVSMAFLENAASQRVLTKLGFHVTGRSARWSHARNAHVPSVDMRLDRWAWLERAPALTGHGGGASAR